MYSGSLNPRSVLLATRLCYLSIPSEDGESDLKEHLVNLKCKIPRYFTSKMSLFGNNCHLRHAGYGKPQASLKHKAEEHYSMEKREKVGRGHSERKSLGGKRELRVMVAPHWLNYGSFSWAGLLLGEEKIFLSPPGVCRASLSQLELVNGGK